MEECSKPVFTLVYAKQATTEAELNAAKEEFEKAGAVLVCIPYDQKYNRPEIKKF